MLKKFYPYEQVESVFSIDYKKLFEKGFKGIIFDLDNTLVPHGANSTPQIDNLFKKIQGIGFKTFILSDNGVQRIENFLKNIDNCPYIDNAGKPNPDNYLKAVEIMNLDKKEVITIGDQTFKDILGANNAGLPSILVKFIGYDTEKKLGIKRRIEKVILKIYKHSKKYNYRLGNIEIDRSNGMGKNKTRKLFSERNQLFFKLAVYKGILRRNLKDFTSKEKFAKNNKSNKSIKLDTYVADYNNYLIKKGTDLELQEGKAINIDIASSKINGIIIHPGETFSYWRTIGAVNKRKGYQNGRILGAGGKVKPGMGGGLCNLANTINLLVLKSPLEITEFHTHTDALAPDMGPRRPLENGTCVGYNYVDYRFKNTTDQDFQLFVWVENKTLYGELRCEKEIPYEYELVEEGHHFRKEGDNYYRVSKIYRNTINKETKEVINKELIWDNHSKVMYDYNLIPKELIKG